MELTAHEAWIKIRASAQIVLPEQTYRTWLASTEAVSLSDDTLVISAPTKFAVEWVEDKYGDLLREIAERELGAQLRLRFEHRGTEERIEFPNLPEPPIDDLAAILPPDAARPDFPVRRPAQRALHLRAVRRPAAATNSPPPRPTGSPRPRRRPTTRSSFGAAPASGRRT